MKQQASIAPEADRERARGPEPSQPAASPMRDGRVTFSRAVGNRALGGLVERLGRRRETSDRRGASRRSPGPDRSVPAAVRDVLTQGGRPLPAVPARELERQSGHSLAGIRIHDGDQASRAARSIGARAFAAGPHIVFAAGQFSPDTAGGLRLLAHELTHVIQQRASGAGRGRALTVEAGNQTAEREADAMARAWTHGARGPAVPTRRPAAMTAASTGRVQRAPAEPPSIASFDVDSFTTKELRDYLAGLDSRGRIEDNLDSDNRARAIVAAWIRGQGEFVLTISRVILLIKEMQSGFTGDDDERAILELLERASDDALRGIFAPGAIDVDDLNSDFHGEEWGWLKQFYERRFTGGMARLKQHKVDPVGAAVPLGVPLGGANATSEPDDRGPAPTAGPAADVKHPELVPTYEEWIHLFASLPTFQARSGHDVLGDKPAPPATATDPGASETERRPAVTTSSKPFYMPGDRFIDGPTEKWVRDNLPENLLATAYQLPSDCADIAVILRHVWLAAHHLEEDYKGWRVGSRLGLARAKEIGKLITEDVTENVGEHMVNPYSDETGKLLLDFPSLMPLLHPGDVLVWHHRKTGSGHVQTIMSIDRDKDGKVTHAEALQGNQPIDRFTAEQITGKKNPDPAVKALRNAPGRRIERRAVRLPQSEAAASPVWNWDDEDRTFLVMAGPPGVKRPTPPAVGGKPGTRRVTDWLPMLRGAALETIESVFESALVDVRTTIERGRGPVGDDEVAAIGRAAGDRLRVLVRDAADLQEGGSSLFRLERMTAQAESIGRGSSARDRATRVFASIAQELAAAARGISSVDFRRRAVLGERMVNVLLTGFDPFNIADSSQPARPGDWNPSGAAVLALDGETVPVEANVKAAVEGVVLPVSFDQFRQGLVETIVDAHRDADAILTVSLDPNLDPDRPVRLEEFAAGVHRLPGGRRENVPPSRPGEPSRPAIFETRADLSGIAAETERPAAGKEPAIARPDIGTAVTLEFADAAEAKAALEALGEPAQYGRVVQVTSLASVRRVVNTMTPDVAPGSSRFTFRAGAREYGASLVSGPGGDYLSNEVSFRVLRRIAETGGGSGPVSFHVHTPLGVVGEVPQDQSTEAAKRVRRGVVAEARRNLARLLETLRRLIQAVARRIARASGAGGAPGGGAPARAEHATER